MPRLARPELHGGLSGENSRVRVTFNDPCRSGFFNTTLDKVITKVPISTRKHYKVPFDRIIPQTLRERALNLLNARIRTYSGNVP